MTAARKSRQLMRKSVSGPQTRSTAKGGKRILTKVMVRRLRTILDRLLRAVAVEVQVDGCIR
jgi:hypothetical protein